MTAGGVVTIYNVGANPFGISPGPGSDPDTMWFTEPGANKIGRIQISTGVVTEMVIAQSTANPSGITPGPDGALWFAEANYGQIGRISDAATPANPLIVQFQLSSSGAPRRIVATADGRMWFTENGSSKLGVLTSY